MLIENYDNWSKYNSINENIRSAKDWYIKNWAEEKRIDLKALTPEQREEILNTSDLVNKVLAIVSNSPGYATAFLKFAVNHGAKPEELNEILPKILDKTIVSNLPMGIDQYANMDEINGVNGFEALADNINSIERRRKGKWFVDSLPNVQGLRSNVKAQSKEILNRYYDLGYIIENDPTLNSKYSKKDIDEVIKKRLFGMTSGITDPINFIDIAEEYLYSYLSSDVSAKLEEIYEIEPEAGVLFANNRYLAISVRTESAQKKICAISIAWCITSRNAFDSYASGDNLQINIFDFGVPPTDNFYLTGATIDRRGNITAAFDLKNNNIKKSTNLRNHLTDLGYPENLINRVIEAIPIETVIKSAVYSFGLDDNNLSKTLTNIITKSYSYPIEDDAEALRIILQILKNRIANNLPKEQIVDLYLKYGILSTFSAKLFNTLLGDVSPETKTKLLTSTEEIFSRLEKYLSTADQNNALLSNPETKKSIEKIVNLKPEIFEIIGKNLRLFESSSPTIAPPKTKPQTAPKPGPIPTIKPSVSPQPKADSNPTIAPPKTKPQTAPKPGPIPTTRPAVSPQPKASENDVITRLFAELKKIGETPSDFLKNRNKI